jgi:type II secretory pathway component PulM
MTILKYFVALVLAGAGVFGAFKLLSMHVVSEWTFCFLILVSVFVGIWVGYSERVREFTLGVGKMSMVLSEMRGAQKEIQESERRMKSLALQIVALVEHLEKSAIVDHTFDQNAFNKAKDEIKKNTA